MKDRDDKVKIIIETKVNAMTPQELKEFVIWRRTRDYDCVPDYILDEELDKITKT